MTELKLPEINETSSTVIDDNIVFVTVNYDDTAENPLEDMDGVGSIFSFSTRHRSFNRESIEEALADPNHVLLSYFEHGQCRWDVASGSLKNTPDFEWDGTANAGVWVPDTSILESAKMLGLKPKTKAYSEWMTKQAESACELFTDFCNGQVFYYDIKAFPALFAPELAANPERHSPVLDLLSDYRHSEPLYADSCGGLFGYNNFQDELKEAAKAALSSLAAPAKETAGSIS